MDQSVPRFDGTSIKHQAFKITKRCKPGFVALLGIMALLMFSSANVLASSDDHSSSKKQPMIYNTPEGQFNGVPALEINGIRLHDRANNPTVTLSGLPVTVLGMDTEGKQVIIEIPATILTATHFLTLDYNVPDHDSDTDDDSDNDDDGDKDDDDDDDDKLKSRHVVFYPYLIGSGTGSVPQPD
jgi:hypothetical protein